LTQPPEDNGEDGLAGGPEGDVPMSFFDHLVELRKRLVRSATGIAVGFVLSYVFVDRLTVWLLEPYRAAWNIVQDRCIAENGVPCLPQSMPQLQNLTAFESVLTDIRIAVFAAIFLAGPILFYQLWMFIAPGLYHREKRLVIPFVSTSAVMFIAGALFCYFLVLPIATEYLLEYPLKKDIGKGVAIVANYTYNEYITYTTKLLLGFGLMFEFPLAVFFLAKAGLVTHRGLLKHWKALILSFFVIAALLTPPDPITQMLMATPMIGLYLISIGVAYVVSKPELERIAKLEAELAVFEDDEDEDGDAREPAPESGAGDGEPPP
jgi:sec-independent protein translocase protein TatC